MASGFRFRFPWFQQAQTPTPAPEPSTQSTRATPQTSVASTSSQRPAVQPPVQEAPPTVATPAPASPSVPAKETETTTETITTIETVGPTTPPQTPPKKPQSELSSPPRSPPQFRGSPLPVSPTRMRTPPQTNSQPRSPSRMATPTKRSPLSSPEASPPRETSHPLSLTQTPPKSPSKTSLSSSAPEIERSTGITKVKGTQTKTTNIPYSTEPKSQKPKPISSSTRVPLPREIKNDISKLIHKLTPSASKQSTNEEPASIITIAGDNKGAIMHLNADALKRDIKQDPKLGENEETKTIVNSNVQGINNSMMFNSSVTERNPGVHLVITRKPDANTNDAKMKNAESLEMQRAQVNVSPPQKVVFDPAIGASMQDDYEPDGFETSDNSYEIEVL